jgi:hypothetical protein
MSVLTISGNTLIKKEWDVEEILKPKSIKDQVEQIELFEKNDGKAFHWYQQGMALEKR